MRTREGTGASPRLAIADARRGRAGERSAELGIANRTVCGTVIAGGASAICELDVLNQLAYPHVVCRSPRNTGNRFDQPSHHDCVQRQCFAHDSHFRPPPEASDWKNGLTLVPETVAVAFRYRARYG